MQMKYLSANSTTTVVAQGPAFLGLITINTATASSVITVYDDVTAVAANKIATVDGNVKGTTAYFGRCKRGITVVTSGATTDCTITYD